MMVLRDKLRAFLVDELDVPSDVLDADYPLLANQVLDSLGLLQVVSFMESECDVQIEDEELVPENFGSINAMVALIEGKQRETAAS